jgi:hypothetical protein
VRVIIISALLVGAWLAVTAASAQGPVAIVEEVTGHPSGIEFMDYVEAGRTIELGPQDSIVLSYLESCQREIIHGGAVKVGLAQSEVISGEVERVKVDCEAGKMMHAVGQTNDSASMVIRGQARRGVRAAPPPEFTLYGLSPMVQLSGDGPLVIARLDKTGEYFAFKIDHNNLLHNEFLDLAADGKSLSAGGVYGARWGGRLTVFKVDDRAKPSSGPLIGRLLRLGRPAS